MSSETVVFQADEADRFVVTVQGEEDRIKQAPTSLIAKVREKLVL